MESREQQQYVVEAHQSGLRVSANDGIARGGVKPEEQDLTHNSDSRLRLLPHRILCGIANDGGTRRLEAIERDTEDGNPSGVLDGLLD